MKQHVGSRNRNRLGDGRTGRHRGIDLNREMPARDASWDDDEWFDWEHEVDRTHRRTTAPGSDEPDDDDW